MIRRFRCERVLPAASVYQRDEFVKAYKEAFGGAPYFETYSDSDVIEEVWKPHLERGVIMVVTDQDAGGKLVGFGCAVPFGRAPHDVQEFLRMLNSKGRLPSEFEHHRAWYMSELGVLNDYRGLGAAWELVKQRMRSVDHSGADQFFMRTAAEHSLSKPMYIKMGARELPDLQDVSNTEQVLENHSHSNQRVYLWGDVRTVAQHIDRIQSVRGYIPFDTSGLEGFDSL